MAKTILEHPVREIHGALERKGIINRMKKYRADDGRIIHEGIQESYAVRNPRDYKKNPPQGAELEHINLFRQACLMTKEILDAEKPEETVAVSIFPPRPKYLTKEEALTLLTDYRKRYFRLDNFIRSMVYQSLKAQQNTQQPTD